MTKNFADMKVFQYFCDAIHKIETMNINELYEFYKQHPVITTDSRDCPEGSIFFALKGESFDGNQFALQALEKGCALAVIDDPNVVEKAQLSTLNSQLDFASSPTHCKPSKTSPASIGGSSRFRSSASRAPTEKLRPKS